jgi:hypothetical protein
MADSIFEFITAKVEERTELDKLEARGTVRIALKEAGLDPRHLSVRQISVMLSRTLPRELAVRGVEGADALCAGLVEAVRGFSDDGDGTPESPEDVFRRLGGR